MVDCLPLLRRLLPGGAHCLLCAAPCDADLCDACDAELPRIRYHCRRCALPLAAPGAPSCGRCLRRPPPFHRCIAALAYQWPADVLLQRFKNGGLLAAGRTLGLQLAATLRQAYQDDSWPALLVPVPLHRRRLRERGFNQALLIARQLGREFDLPVAYDLLEATRAVRAQKRLPAAQRRVNLRGVFRRRRPVRGHLALVDDVMTTGASATELSSLLLAGGATRVDVWCLTRTPAPDVAVDP